jgi:hypothetical protein
MNLMIRGQELAEMPAHEAFAACHQDSHLFIPCQPILLDALCAQPVARLGGSDKMVQILPPPSWWRVAVAYAIASW